ncbi:MAG: hypothetical protein IIY14_02010 [Bacteroidales bacterium]|nr:hypothetical protein [Bacteroidales bacterium]
MKLKRRPRSESKGKNEQKKLEKKVRGRRAERKLSAGKKGGKGAKKERFTAEELTGKVQMTREGYAFVIVGDQWKEPSTPLLLFPLL